jgi:hypothetical protein
MFILQKIKHLRGALLLSAALFIFGLGHSGAADDPQIGALRSADDARVNATIRADKTILSAILSDSLRYAHSNGVVDTKTKLIESISSGRIKYESISFEERNVSIPVSGVGLISGRAQVKVSSETGAMNATLSFLSVWREEQGQWRFLAWQSCKLP